LYFVVPGGQITEAGLRQNISVGIQYIESWLRGTGAAAIFNLMEDTATAEISRAQIWQWIHHPQAALTDGRKVTGDLYLRMVPEELARVRELYGEKLYRSGKFDQAARLFESLVTGDQFDDFLTLSAYDLLD
jgi:malate synthase